MVGVRLRVVVVDPEGAHAVEELELVPRQPQERDALLALLWPEFDAPSARNNLRRELSRSHGEARIAQHLARGAAHGARGRAAGTQVDADA